MKTRKLTAILLALCMLLSLSISAFAADDAVVSGTIPDSKITWELDGKGWLTISGSGDCSAFTSKDDQPWAEYRSQITQVWFDGMESLAISDLAYWFEDCTNLTTAEIPSTTPVIGRHAFYNCPLLTKLSIYYGEHTLDSIGEDAFWRETDSGDTLYIGYLIGYPKSSVPFHTYDWAASNRSERYFYDLYGVYQNADAGSAATSGIKKAPGISVQSTGTIIGNCPSCGKHSFQGTYVEVAHSSRGHANYMTRTAMQAVTKTEHLSRNRRGDRMRICIEESTYEGTSIEILTQLRALHFDAGTFDGTEGYIRYMQNTIRCMTETPCELPEGSTEERAAALIHVLQEIGALELLEE